MKRRFAGAALGGIFLCPGLVAQRHGDPRPQWQEKYPSQMARLEAMAVLPISNWRYHDADIPHGEDPSLDDSGWPTATLPYSERRMSDSSASPERGWYRTTFVVPSTAGGKDIAGARLKLAVRFSRDGRVFLNGGLVAQGDGRTLDPVAITSNAAAGQKIQIAIKVPFHEAQGRFLGARILVDYPGQADPGVLRSEIQTAEAVISGFPQGKEEREKQLDKAVNDVDFRALDQADQQVFSRSLETAESDLQPLNAWMKQFTVRLVGNAHIDMAWL
jgi:alpha-mannosidase